MAAGLIERSTIFFLTLGTGFCTTLEYPFTLRPDKITTTLSTSTDPSGLPVACNTSYDTVAYIRGEIYVFKGKYYSNVAYAQSIPIATTWPSLPTDLTHVDVAYERQDQNVSFFIGKYQYVLSLRELLPGYPKPLTSLGLPESLEKLDAAMIWGENNKTYFYSGKLYWRFDEEEGRVEIDYPRDMSMWQGVGYNIDSAYTWKNGKTYFFKGKGYWKFDNYRMRVERAELRLLSDFWLGCPRFASVTSTTELPFSTTVKRGNDDVTTYKRSQKNKCTLPQYPNHGSYTTNEPGAEPGQTFNIVAINVTCQEGYLANAPHFTLCFNGLWSSPIPQCIALCQLPPHPSVEYRCLVSLDWMDGFRACNEYEPSGTQVRPSCREHYYSTSTLKYMHCTDGEWSNIQKCTPECGTLIPNGTQLVLGGETAYLGEVPWHAGIYTKTTQPYKQICGGSLISTNTVISAAHCFWSNLLGTLPASSYAVAVGKLRRHWESELDNPQKSDVKSLHLPARFRGSASNYQDDIAVVMLSISIQYNTYIRPVCVDFDVNFERRQLQPGVNGKVAGWGLTSGNGAPAQLLQVVNLPYINIQECIEKSPASFIPYITSDKICAGFNNAGSALCKGDSGGGLTFPELDKGTLRYYIRGVTSTAPTNDDLCNANTYIGFTRLINHEHFITRFWED